MDTLLDNPIVIIFGSTTLISVVGTIAFYWHRARLDEIEASLKHAMLEKGMSADDIVKVLKARPENPLASAFKGTGRSY